MDELIRITRIESFCEAKKRKILAKVSWAGSQFSHPSHSTGVRPPPPPNCNGPLIVMALQLWAADEKRGNQPPAVSGPFSPKSICATGARPPLVMKGGWVGGTQTPTQHVRGGQLRLTSLPRGSFVTISRFPVVPSLPLRACPGAGGSSRGGTHGTRNAVYGG